VPFLRFSPRSPSIVERKASLLLVLYIEATSLCRGARCGHYQHSDTAPWLQRIALGQCAKDSQQPNIVFVAKERANIDQLSIADLRERGRNFFFLHCCEEAGAFGEFATLNGGRQMTVNRAEHEGSI
jgi:hypothetical protein